MSEENKEENKDHQQKQKPETPSSEETEPVAEIHSQEELLENKLKETQKELLYLRAEFDNYKKNSLKEKSSILKYAGEGLARDLLGTLDVFEKALNQEVNETNFKEFVKGITLTKDQLKADLKKHDIVEIDCKGKPFDPNTCEALTQVPTEDAEEGEVIEVMRKGFMFRDKVLRYAQVVTATKPKTENS